MTTQTYYGVTTLKRLQLGKEVTQGVGVLPTAVWRGEAGYQDDAKVVNPPENVGLMPDTDRAYIPSLGGTITLQPTPATYEQLPYLLEMGVKALGTGVADGGGGSGKIYTYPFPTSSQLVPNTYSIEGGDNAQMKNLLFAYLTEFKLTGKYDEAVMMSGTIKTRAPSANSLTGTGIAFDNAHHITDSNNGLAVFAIGQTIRVNGTANNNGTFTVTASAAGSLTVTETTATEAAGGSVTIEQMFTALALPTVRDMLFNQTQLYIDDVGGTIGTTNVAKSFLGFEFDYKTGQKGQSAGDGRLDFSFLKQVKPSGTLKVTYEHVGNSKAEIAKWLAKTPRLIRIKNTGVALTTAGSVYSFYTMILDVPGIWTKFGALKDDAGNSTVDGELKMGYDATYGSFGQLIVVNQLASLT